MSRTSSIRLRRHRGFDLRVRLSPSELVQTIKDHPETRLTRELHPYPPPPLGARYLVARLDEEGLVLRHYANTTGDPESPELHVKFEPIAEGTRVVGRFAVGRWGAPRRGWGMFMSGMWLVAMGAIVVAMTPWGSFPNGVGWVEMMGAGPLVAYSSTASMDVHRGPIMDFVGDVFSRHRIEDTSALADGPYRALSPAHE